MIAGGECAPAPGTSAVNSIPKRNFLNNDFEYFCSASRIGPDTGRVQQLSQGASSNPSTPNLSYVQAVLPRLLTDQLTNPQPCLMQSMARLRFADAQRAGDAGVVIGVPVMHAED